MTLVVVREERPMRVFESGRELRLRSRRVGLWLLVGVLAFVTAVRATEGWAGAATINTPSTWSLVSPAAGIAPSPRTAVMAYDPQYQQVVLFGGYAGAYEMGDTWTWDGTRWVHRSPAHVPPSRFSDQMAWDAATHQLVMFGGAQVGGGLSDTWTWNGADWIRLSPATSPPNRAQGAMAYDPATGQLVLFGGFQYTSGPGGTIVNDTWTWNGATWTQLHPAVSPPPTASGSLAYDPSLRKLVLFGGEIVPNDTWAWDGSNWSKLALRVAPPQRLKEAMALDPANNLLIMASGVPNLGLPYSDTWRLTTNWLKLLPATAAPAVDGAAIAADPGTGNLVLFGGSVNGGYVSQTWVFSPLAVVKSSAPSLMTVGLDYSFQLLARGGVPPLSWSVTGGSLPPGLSLSPRGVISGLATQFGSFPVTVTVRDSSPTPQSSSAAFHILAGIGPLPGFYVANGASPAVLGFALRANGNTPPIAKLTGPLTELNGAAGIGFDPAGDLYVANSGNDTVEAWGPGANGNVPPVTVLGGPDTGLHSPYGVAFDSGTNQLVVADRTANAVTVYTGTPSFNGDLSPAETIAGPDTQLSSPQAVQVDSAGDIWVANAQSSTVTEYPPGSNGDQAPIATIDSATGLLNRPQGMVFDGSDNLFVSDTFGNEITSYSRVQNLPGVVLTSSPDLTIVGPSTMLSLPVGIDLDAASRLYVANESGTVTVFPSVGTLPGPDTPPADVIAGPATGLAAPLSLAVLPPLYVATRHVPHARVGHAYRVQLYALLGRRPLRWKVLRARLPRGLHLTRGGLISGTPVRASRRWIVLGVSDSTHPAMRASVRLRLTVTARRPHRHRRT
jgi:hypothetical protein